jgi:hypothetical protein
VCIKYISVAHTKFYTASNDRRISEKCTAKDAKESDNALIHAIPPKFA